MMTLTRSFTMSLCLLLVLLPVAVSANFDGAIKITAPETVGIGQPFLVHFTFPSSVKDLEVQWNGHSLHPAIESEGGNFSSTVLLGTSLTTNSAIYPLDIKGVFNGTIVHEQRKIKIVTHKYQRETLSVEPSKIKPPKSVSERINKERELLLEAIRTISPKRMWTAPFSLPVKGKMLSRFGLYRVFNKDVKRRHKGLDFRAYLGTPICAIAPGKVVLVGDFYFAGNCVLIDHGNGVVSMSVHMSKVLVKEGNFVNRGQKIGLSGSTGRATGAHLHLSVFAQGVSIDPEPLFKMSESDFK